VPRDTTHLSVVDADGNAVSLTHSLAMPSGIITPGLGFLYNGCMGVFDPRPGRAGSIQPGKSRFTSSCPTMTFKDGELDVVLGAPGGTQIAMGVLQVLLNVVDHGMEMQAAVSAPRFSSTSNAIDVCNRIPRSVTRTSWKHRATPFAATRTTTPSAGCTACRWTGRWPARRGRPRPRWRGVPAAHGSSALIGVIRIVVGALVS
jgi:gamma-glutamyltranspeptidase